MKTVLIAIACLFFAFMAEAQEGNVVVADSVTKMPLASASVFDRHSKLIGICNSKGQTPYIFADNYPITVRYLGYKERSVEASTDTIFLQEQISELDEVVVESRERRVLHMLAYMREYSTLTTYTDTVFMFREKMVDYMLSPDYKIRFRGWSKPRVLKAKSYYRFTDAQGLDSVSDECRYHFSWSDWMGVGPVAKLPAELNGAQFGSDTIYGRYSPTETWTKNDDRMIVDINVLADTTSRKWVPNLSGFFRNDLDFENFRVRFNYDNVTGDTVCPMDLTGYSFNIESNGRGHGMFWFNRVNEPFFVSTYAEVYIMDKEYITVKEAKKWDNRKFNTGEIEILEPEEAPALQPAIEELVERVNNIDKAGVRLAVTPDHRLISTSASDRNFKIGRRALFILKGLLGISRHKFNKNIKRKWKSMTEELYQPHEVQKADDSDCSD
ncbi:MAG: hypothetical protein K2K94_06635 [Muribaculaceae bacterium]|nr:hypothetical protein [Muribaculaceae bacterium]